MSGRPERRVCLEDSSRSDVSVCESGSLPNFFTLKYGDNEEALLNSRCTCHTLIAHIRRKCMFKEGVVLDVIDLDGNVRHLSNHLTEDAHLYIDSRSTYILIQIDKKITNGETHRKYTSLLNNLEGLYPDMPEKLSNLSRPDSERPSVVRRESKWNTVRKRLAGRQANIAKKSK